MGRPIGHGVDGLGGFGRSMTLFWVWLLQRSLQRPLPRFGLCLERGLNHRDMRILREDSDDVFSTLFAARIVLKSVIGELTLMLGSYASAAAELSNGRDLNRRNRLDFNAGTGSFFGTHKAHES